MEYAKLSVSSLRHIGNMDEVKKADRYYLRYYLTIKRARKLNEQIYGDAKDKSGKQLKTKHPLRVAALTQAIKNQSISDYHMNWLVGVLHDAKEDDLMTYNQEIDDVLADLLPEEKARVLLYIDQLTSDQTLSKGMKKAQQIEKMEVMDLVPCWIRIFDKYDNCRRFKLNPLDNSKEKLAGYFSIAYLCYKRACERYEEIQKNLQPEIHAFYHQLFTEVGGPEKVINAKNKFIEKYK